MISIELRDADRILMRRPLDEGQHSVGANPECDIALPGGGLAPIQCELRRSGTALLLLNRSPRGTVVNDEEVTGEFRLAQGDVIHLGDLVGTISFQADAGLAAPEGGNTRTLRVGHVGSPTLKLTCPTLDAHRHWPVTDSGLSLGTESRNDIVLDDPYVSGFHAQVTVEGGTVMLRDLDSRNGTLLDDAKVGVTELRAGQTVTLGQTKLQVHALKEDGEPTIEVPQFIWRSSVMADVESLTQRVARTDACVLITGETGTGKEVTARQIASLSARSQQPFVAINCGTLSKNLIASELFGYEKGAFTGAQSQKAGAFEVADGGTLFLDEIGELPVELQPQLLRVLENGEVRRVGSADAFHVDVRVLAATNRSLVQEVREGRFREDLYHRLHVLPVELPALRDRADDIPLLAQHFVQTFSTAEPVALSEGALGKLKLHPWPGNVRELKNVIQRAVLLRTQDVLEEADISFVPSTLDTRVATGYATTGRTLQELEREAIMAELRRTKGSQKLAAEALGVSRSTIYRKIEELGINIEEFRV